MDRVTASWVRVRLRTAPAAAAALALLVALTACLAAVFPRALDRYRDAGLVHAVERAHPDRTSVWLFAPGLDDGSGQPQREDALRPAALGRQFAGVLRAVQRPLVADRAQSSYGVQNSDPLAVPDTFIPRPSGLPARLRLVAQNGLGGHSSVRAGRLPRVNGTVTAATAEVEAAVTAETARSLRLRVGSVLHVPGAARRPLAVRVTGILDPREPGGAYWASEPLLRTPSLVRVPSADPQYYWLGALLLQPEAAPALLGTPGHPFRYWQIAPDTRALHAHELGGLKSSVAALESGPGLGQVRTVTDQTTQADTDLDDVLNDYDRLAAGIEPLVSVAAFGTATVAAVVLLMAGGLAADRRRAELALLRARGSSLRALGGRLLAETAVAAVPAGALGLAAALLAVPTERRVPAVLAAVAVTALACSALPLRAMVTHRAVRVHGPREDAVSRRPSRRRTVAELTLLVIAAGAVEALRRRGVSGTSGASGSGGGSAETSSGVSGDQLVSLAPVLVGVIAALVLVRLYPLPLRRLAGPARRLRGAVGHLSLARAGRTSVSAVLPLLALLTALTTAAFGGSVLAGISDARDHAALSAVGADARVEGSAALPAGLPDRVRRAPGVGHVSEMSVDYQAKAGANLTPVSLAGVAPADYASLAGRTGLGPFPVERLHRPAAGRSSALPALASPSVARTYGTQPFPVRLGDGADITVRIAVVRDRTPAVVGDEFLVVDRAGLDRAAARTTTLLVTGAHLDAHALRAATGKAASVQLRSEERAHYVDSPLQTGAGRVYAAAVAASAGYAVLALLLALLRAAPERAALLARLRTMGLTRAQGRRLLILESLPQAVLAAAGGALTGWATIRLLSPGIDLTTVALPPAAAYSGAGVLRTDPLSLALPAAAVLLLAVGVAAGQAWWTGRRGSVRELRAGDSG
ncbi:FtsX-like permease family protein [Streptomyces naganishii]|uniref:Membrane protein n=1 Tax=Streptomyces naganishii JCM 4654 TaxID=1306179 RepID=A0A918Y4J2_9ACTN|nr:FtsX-like permease family protein [Streptomyces naganishii]GHD89763.1 membrane protein [Streptomyces naganishii JCM 4654]